MSAISTTSVDVDTIASEREPTSSNTPHPLKGSAIPRPSFQQTRSSTDTRSTTNGSPLMTNGNTSPDPRTRTNSHPYTFDPHHQSSNGNSPVKPYTNGVPVSPPPEHSPSHATSPYSGRSTDAKPTRIPKATTLARTASLSSQRHLPSPTVNSFLIDGKNGYGSYSPPILEPSIDHHHHHHYLHHSPVAETSYSNNSRSAISASSQQHSRLLQEPPPFQSDSMSSPSHSLDHSQEDDMMPGRPSNDSEERPFEHWYRGEVSRNGGVGELRVGKRQEMLDIANYGHTLRKITPRNTATRPVDDTPRRRKRADSVAGIGDRESFYLDEERAKEVARVLDEGPLTDLDVDEDSDYSMSIRHEAVTAQARLGRETPTNSHMSSRQQSLPPSRIPAPIATRQSSEPPRMPTPPIPQRFASEPPSFPSTSTPLQSHGTAAMPRSASQPQGPDQTAKRRAKSPMTPPSASKRSKATALSIANKRAAEDDKNRRSVAYYPTPEDGVDMVNAIPSWTQPVPASGGWDEVRFFFHFFRLANSLLCRLFCLL
jgi:hypothetical protein